MIRKASELVEEFIEIEKESPMDLICLKCLPLALPMKVSRNKVYRKILPFPKI